MVTQWECRCRVAFLMKCCIDSVRLKLQAAVSRSSWLAGPGDYELLAVAFGAKSGNSRSKTLRARDGVVGADGQGTLVDLADVCAQREGLAT